MTQWRRRRIKCVPSDPNLIENLLLWIRQSCSSCATDSSCCLEPEPVFRCVRNEWKHQDELCNVKHGAALPPALNSPNAILEMSISDTTWTALLKVGMRIHKVRVKDRYKLAWVKSCAPAFLFKTLPQLGNGQALAEGQSFNANPFPVSSKLP